MLRLARLVAALLLVSPAAAGLEDFNLGDAIRGAPGAIKNSFGTFKRGTGAMWRNSKEAGLIKKRVSRTGCPPSYEEAQLIRRSGEDTSKLVQAGITWLVAPELIPAMLYFFPRALPSTFESEQGREKRHASMCRMRASATLELLMKLEETAAGTNKKALRAQPQAECATLVLRAKSVGGALAPLEDFVGALPQVEGRKSKKPTARAALKGLPQPLLKTGCKLIGVSGPLPGPIRRGSLAKHLEQIVEEDALLTPAELDSLPRSALIEACLDRGVGHADLPDAALRKHLSSWLSLVSSREAALGADPFRLRLAALAASATVSTRAAKEATLPRLLFN